MVQLDPIRATAGAAGSFGAAGVADHALGSFCTFSSVVLLTHHVAADFSPHDLLAIGLRYDRKKDQRAEARGYARSMRSASHYQSVARVLRTGVNHSIAYL
ncbi:MAG TPA: hypothetical protein VK324_08540 [Tepidisphaeraceae bacterium]|nr:hypothetical protein [Tepidisphaeraceae bacterium]